MATPTEVLKNAVARKRLVWVVFGVVFTVLVLRFFVLPVWENELGPATFALIARIFEAIAVALLTGLLIPALAIWLGPDLKEIDRIQVLDRKYDTTPAFEKALAKTSRWYFRGGKGSFFRSTTLPNLEKQAPPVNVVLVMLNVNDDELLQRYAGYRTAQNKEEVSAEQIRLCILCSIWALHQSVKRQGAIVEATVHLANNYSSFRIDLSEKEVFLTQDDLAAPAIRFSSDSSYYKGFENEFRQSWALSVNLALIRKEAAGLEPKEFFLKYFEVELTDKEVGSMGDAKK